MRKPRREGLEFNEEDLQKLQKRAKMFARQYMRGFQLEREDFPSYCVEKALERRFSVKAPNMHWLIVDYLRESNGRDKNADHAPIMRKFSVEDLYVHKQRDAWERFIKAPEVQESLLSEIEKVRLYQNERIAMILYYGWGFSQKEIGKILQVTESRVCQLIKIAEAKVRNVLADE